MSKDVTGVYKITSPTNKVYIGSSINIRKRWNRYMNLDCKAQPKLYNSLKKHGVSNHKFEILYKCDTDVLLQAEAGFGLMYKVLSKEKGLNHKLPKIGEYYIPVSEDTREKMRRNSLGSIPWNKGKRVSKEERDRLKKICIGRKVWNKGKKFSEESKRKMSESSKGNIAWNRKLVLCQETGIFYNSITEAAKYNNMARSTLQAMLNGVNPNKTNLINI